MKLNLKVYESNGTVGIIAIEEGGLHRTADITIPKAQFDTLTVSQFKTKLPDYWPTLSSTGFVLWPSLLTFRFVKQQTGPDRMFLDDEILKDIPIVYGTSHQLTKLTHEVMTVILPVIMLSGVLLRVPRLRKLLLTLLLLAHDVPQLLPKQLLWLLLLISLKRISCTSTVSQMGSSH